MNKVLVSHLSDEWATPKALYDFFLKSGYKDPCPLGATNGLDDDWSGKVFVNPPYSKIKDFVYHFIVSLGTHRHLRGWFLVPSRSDTEWFTQLFYMSDEVLFIKRRLSFGVCGKTAPFPSVLFHVYDRELGDKQNIEIVDREEVLAYLRRYELEEVR